MAELYKYAVDGFTARVVKRYTKNKYAYLEEYIKIFTKGIKYKWAGNLVYIDLFSCCGKSIIKENNEEIDGSPLIALRYPFKYYFFNDIDHNKLEALKFRIKKRFPEKYNICFFSSYDVNIGIQNLITEHSLLVKSPQPLCLIFSDPNNLNPHYSTFKYISDNLKADILCHLSTGIDLGRNFEKSKLLVSSKIDDFFGDRNWRSMKKDESIKYYFLKLKNLGYLFEQSVPPSRPICNRRNRRLYHLYLLTKNNLGLKFSKISLNYSLQQGDLFSG